MTRLLHVHAPCSMVGRGCFSALISFMPEAKCLLCDATCWLIRGAAGHVGAQSRAERSFQIKGVGRGGTELGDWPGLAAREAS